MRKPRWILPLLFVLFSPLPLAGETVVKDMMFSPPSFTAGDTVRLRLTLDLAPGAVLRPPQNLPLSDWAQITSIDTPMEGTEVIITFIPFAPGARTLPLLDLGDLQLPGPKVFVDSILASHENLGLRGIRAPLLLPGTRLVLALMLTLMVASPPIIYTGFLFLYRWILHQKKRWMRRRPGKRLRKLLKRLGLENKDRPSVVWYTLLTEGLRDYLGSLTNYDCRSATTAEISRLPGFDEADSFRGNLLHVLQEGDLVKFAGRESSEEEQKKTLFLIEKIMQALQKEEEDAHL